MTWLDMANLLYDKSNTISPRGAHLHLDTAAWLRTTTPHQNQAADSAARFFARHQEWPVLEEDLAPQLFFRCLRAIECCIKLDAERATPPRSEAAAETVLEQLLITGWHEGGLEWAEKRYAMKPLAF